MLQPLDDKMAFRRRHKKWGCGMDRGTDAASRASHGWRLARGVAVVVFWRASGGVWSTKYFYASILNSV